MGKIEEMVKKRGVPNVMNDDDLVHFFFVLKVVCLRHYEDGRLIADDITPKNSKHITPYIIYLQRHNTIA